MIIEDVTKGWLIEPTTSEEAQALKKIFEGLRELNRFNRAVFSQASHLPPEDQNQNKGV